MAVQLGGEAKNSKKAEFGFARIRSRNHSKLLTNINDEIKKMIWPFRCMDESWHRSYKITKRI